jgi:hypothetical protein
MAIRQTVFSDESIAENLNEAAYQEISDSVDEESQEILELIQSAKEKPKAAETYNEENVEAIDNQAEEMEQSSQSEQATSQPVQPVIKKRDPVEETAEPVQELTVEEILPPYEDGLDFLRNLAVEKLDMLIQNLIDEYNAMDPQEREKLSNKTALATKYIALAKDLETRIDGTFYHLMDQLEVELLANKQSTESVKTLTKQYLDEKELRRNELLKKAM